MIRPPAFKGTVAAAATQYVGIPVGPRMFIDIAWLDAISSATITLETTGFDAQDAPVDAAGAAWEWKTEADVTITGPAASAAGSAKVHITGIGPCRARLKIVAAANCSFEIYAATA